MRGRLWIVVLLPLGAGVGFLSLETIGIPLIPIVLNAARSDVVELNTVRLA
jgi:hypothetical protein